MGRKKRHAGVTVSTVIRPPRTVTPAVGRRAMMRDAHQQAYDDLSRDQPEAFPDEMGKIETPGASGRTANGRSFSMGYRSAAPDGTRAGRDFFPTREETVIKQPGGRKKISSGVEGLRVRAADPLPGVLLKGVIREDGAYDVIDVIEGVALDPVEEWLNKK